MKRVIRVAKIVVCKRRSLHRGRGLKRWNQQRSAVPGGRSLHRGRGLKLRDEISDIEAQISRSLRGSVD